MNMLSCQEFINNNDYIVILKCPNRMSQEYFNKGFTQFKCDEKHLKKIPDLVLKKGWCSVDRKYRLSHAM